MHFNLDLFHAFLGFASIILVTSLAVLGNVVDFKDSESRRLTKWGRYAIFGIALTFFISTSILWTEYLKKANDAKEAAQRSERLTAQTLEVVRDINRALHPIKEVR